MATTVAINRKVEELTKRTLLVKAMVRIGMQDRLLKIKNLHHPRYDTPHTKAQVRRRTRESLKMCLRQIERHKLLLQPNSHQLLSILQICPRQTKGLAEKL